MTLEELRPYDGVQDERVLLAVCGNIYDVTRGKDFYGPGGPYEKLAGHDATRALATFDAKAVKDEHDDLEGLTQDDLNDAKE
ncbi:UNVERIFIED_CONTAM: Protein vem-1, partial [Eudyptes robustus]